MTDAEALGNQMNRFLKYFKEELQDQAKGKPPNKL